MQPAARALEGRNILIIAEAFESIEPLLESLRAAGAVVVVVRTPGLALAYSERHTVLVDLREPGWSLTPEIRALRSLSRVPMYALKEPGETLDATADVAGDFVKPVRVEALIETLSALPRRSR